MIRQSSFVVQNHVDSSQNQGIVVHFINVLEDFDFRELSSLEQISEEAVYVSAEQIDLLMHTMHIVMVVSFLTPRLFPSISLLCKALNYAKCSFSYLACELLFTDSFGLITHDVLPRKIFKVYFNG